MPTLDLTLTIEQDFKLAQITADAEKLSPEQCREMLIEVARQLMIKDNIIRQLIRCQP
jgi:hypothetical protein